jgi:hypothetical protein
MLTAGGHASLLATLNGAPDAAAVHASFCAAYLGAAVTEAHVVCVDRSGFTILGRHVDAADSLEEGSGDAARHVHGGDDDSAAAAAAEAQRRQQWREFRFAFSEEVTTREQLLQTLRDMAAEATEQLSAS